MQRQLDTNTHEVKDWVMNCIHLQEYFVGMCMYSQCLYLLQGAMTLLPENPAKRKKLRATIQISMGNLYLNLMMSCNGGQDMSKINDKVVTFDKLETTWPTVKPVVNAEDAIQAFKLGNTQF